MNEPEQELFHKDDEIKYNELDYSVSNESIKAVVVGLDVSSEDTVLAIGGSGDQALALLEKAGKVVAVDMNRTQIRYIKQRVRQLQEGRFEDFLRVGGPGRQNDTYDNNDPRSYNQGLLRRATYFREPGRLETIRNNLSKIDITEGDVLSVSQSMDFSKLFLSNSLGHILNRRKDTKIIGRQYTTTPSLLREVTHRLASGGLVYVSDHTELTSLFRLYSNLPKIEDISFREDIIPQGLKLDTNLTRRAQELDGGAWGPGVYRKA